LIIEWRQRREKTRPIGLTMLLDQLV
jgi:hypothetical protein